MGWLDGQREVGTMDLVDLLREKIEKQMVAINEQLDAAEAEAKLRKAKAEADVAGAELEQEVLARVGSLRDRLEEGRAFLRELAEAGDEKADEIKARVARFFD
jgi:hypothetical protein